jgi:hypothetical protein
MSFGKLLIGALLVGIGVVFLGTSLGYVPKDVWPSLLQYWPLLLVAVGVAFLANAIKNIVLGWLAVVIVVGGLLLGAWWFTTHQPKTRGSGAVTTIDLTNPPVDAMTLRARAFLGRIVVGSEAGRSLRVETLHVPEKMRDAHHWTVTGRSGVLDWPGEPGAAWAAPIGGEFHASLPEHSPVQLELKAQLSTLEADLAKLRAERATLEVIGCSVRLTASDRSGPQRIRLKGVLTDARVRLPADVPVRVIYHSWFGLRTMPADFIEHVGGRGRDKIFKSEGRGQPVEIEIDGPLLRIQIERAPPRAVERADSPAPGLARSEHAPGTPRT